MLKIMLAQSTKAYQCKNLWKLTSDVKQRKQWSQHNKIQKNKRCETKKRVTGSVTKETPFEMQFYLKHNTVEPRLTPTPLITAIFFGCLAKTAIYFLVKNPR